jgi:hypothetical protein
MKIWRRSYKRLGEDKQIQNNGKAYTDIIMDRKFITGTTRNKLMEVKE